MLVSGKIVALRKQTFFALSAGLEIGISIHISSHSLNFHLENQKSNTGGSWLVVCEYPYK